VRVSLMARQS